MAQQQAAEAQARKEQQGKLFRFFLQEIGGKGSGKFEEARITFVDGDLDPKQGVLLPPRYYEHFLYFGGSYQNFVCPEKTLPESNDVCPICELGDKKLLPSLVSLFTIIDHRQYKGQNDKIYQYTRKLLVAKPQTFELLNKLATSLGGLSGRTFDVSRVGDKSASVGSLFIPVGDKESPEVLKKKFMRTWKDPKTNEDKYETNFQVPDYEQEIVFRNGLQMRQMGLGKPSTGVAMAPGGSSPEGQTAEQIDYSKEL